MSAQYDVQVASDGRTYFTLKAGNGEVILTSQMYTTEEAALNGIESCRTNGKDEAHFARLEAEDGRAYFDLKAPNGQVIGTSQMYSSTSARDHGIRSVIENAMVADTKLPKRD